MACCSAAGTLLAFCNMRTLYLRNVPDDVMERLQRLAARESTSVGAIAVRELAEASRRVDNPVLLGSLPDLGVDAATVLEDVDAGRAGR
jgi:plasmid stability protein